MMFKAKYPMIGLLLSFTALTALILMTSPVDGGPVIIVAFLTLAFLSLYTGVLTVLSLLPRRLFGGLLLTTVSKHYIGLVVSAGGAYVLGLLTIGQLQLLDVLLVMLFEAITVFYILRRL